MKINDKGEVVFRSIDELSNFVGYYAAYILLHYRDSVIYVFKNYLIKNGVIERRKNDD